MGKMNKREKYSLWDRLRIPTYDNPKQMKFGNLNFDKEKCRQCSFCIAICPGGCLLSDTVTKSDFMNNTVKSGKGGFPRVDSPKPGVTLCVACGDCLAVCPHGAITIKSNFNAGFYFKKITQNSDMHYPKNY